MATNRWASTIIGQQEQLDTLLSRLGTAAGADLATDIATVDTEVGVIDGIVDNLLLRAQGAYGIAAATLESKKLYGALSIDGAAADFEAGATDFDSTTKFFCFAAAATSYVSRLVLFMEDSNFAETGPLDMDLLPGGNAAATSTGFQYGVNDVGTAFSTPILASEEALNISEMATKWGADVFRFSSPETGATDGNNSDSVIVVVDFVKLFGAPVEVATGEYIGVNLDVTLTGIDHVQGAVFGRIA